jgi:hypothetical protein
MPDKEIITLENAQISAERFLEERLVKLKKLSIEKLQLTSVEGIIVYEVEGKANIGGGFFVRSTVLNFKIQVAAADGAIVGYETTGVKTE